MAKRRVLSLIIDLKDQASKKMAGIAKATAAFAAAGLAIGLRFAKQSIDAFTVQEDALNAINAALMANNKLSEEGLDLIVRRASEIQQITKAGDEAIISAVSTLSLLAGELDARELASAEEALVGIAATFFKGDLATAALMMGKSIGTAVNALTRYGIQVDTTGTQQEKLAQIMAQSGAFFEVAAARAKTLSGRMEQASNAFGDFKEKIGEVLQDKTTLKTFFFELTNVFSDMATALDGSTEDIKLAFELVGQFAGQAFMAAFLSQLSKGFRLLVPKFLERWVGEEWAALSEQGFENASESIELLHALAERVRARLPKPEEGAGGGGGAGGGAPGAARGLASGSSTFGLGLGPMFGGGGGAGGLFGGGIPFAPSPEALSVWERFRGFVQETGVAIREATDNTQTMGEVTGGILLQSVQNLGAAFEAVGASMVDTSVQIGDAFKGAMLGAIASVARGLSQFYAAKAIAAFALGISGDPRGFAAGAKYLAASAAMGVVAGVASAASASGGGGGGGGASAIGFGDQAAGAGAGEAVIVIQGGFLDMSDSRQVEAFAKALGNVYGRRISIVEG